MARYRRYRRRSGFGGKKLITAGLIGLGCTALLGRGIPGYVVAYVAGGPIAVGGALLAPQIASMASGVMSTNGGF